MISAMDALALPGCTLSDEEREGADALERAIDACIEEKMSIKGIIFHTKELRPNVIVETGRRYRLAGWNTEWSPIEEENRFNKAARKHVGWQLAMVPSEASHAEYARLVPSEASHVERARRCLNPKHLGPTAADTEECCALYNLRRPT